MNNTQLSPFESLRLTTQNTKSGKRYVFAYRNKWDPEKPQSRTEYREHIGSILPGSSLVHFSTKFLDRRPEFKDRLFYFHCNDLIEVGYKGEQVGLDSTYLDLLNIGASWACWKMAEDHKIREDLNPVFSKNGDDILRLAIYFYLSGEVFSGFNTWLCNHWLPEAKPLSSQRISEILESIDSAAIEEFFKRRLDRILSEDKPTTKAQLPEGKRFLAFDANCVVAYSQTLDEAAYGKAKRKPELKKINLILVIDKESGDTCYVKLIEGSLTSTSLFATFLKDMEEKGFDLDQVILVTERGYLNLRYLPDLLKSGVAYISGVPLTEGDMQGKFMRYKDKFLDLTFWNEKFDVAALNFSEEFVVPTIGGNLREKPWLHIYRHVRDGYSEVACFFERLDEVLELKNQDKPVAPSVWRQYSKYCIEQDGRLTFNLSKVDAKSLLANCFALRSNCVSDPFICLQAYRDRTIVDGCLRQFKTTTGKRLYVTDDVYQGKLFIHLLGQVLQIVQRVTARNNETAQLKVPNNSIRQLLERLNAIFALQVAGKYTWLLHPIPQSAKDALSLFGLKENEIPVTITPP